MTTNKPEVEPWADQRQEQAPHPAEVAVTDDMRQAVRWAPSSAYWSQRLFEFFGPDARDGIAALEKQLREAQAALTAAGGREETRAERIERISRAALAPIVEQQKRDVADYLAATQPAQEKPE